MPPEWQRAERRLLQDVCSYSLILSPSSSFVTLQQQQSLTTGFDRSSNAYSFLLSEESQIPYLFLQMFT
jgi:hypothetical protein